jgi:single-strand DNA-binding protein
MNTVNLTGRLTATPELKQTNSGMPVCNFTIAVKRPANHEETDFVPCVAWKNGAEYLCRYGEKGRMVGVTGAVNSRKWVDAEGKNRSTIEINCRSVEVLQFVEKDGSSEPVISLHSDLQQISNDADLPF